MFPWIGQLRNHGKKPWQGKEICLNSKASRLIFGPTEPYIYWIMCPDHEADHTECRSQNEWNHASTAYAFMPCTETILLYFGCVFFTHPLMLEYLCQDHISCCMQLCQIFFLRISDMCDKPYVTHHLDIPAMNKLKVCWGLG